MEEYEELKERRWIDQISDKPRPRSAIKLGSTKTVVPRTFLAHHDQIKGFPIRADDVWIVTYPKCGTTWTQEMVWCLMNGLDFEAAKTQLDIRSPFFELSGLFGGDSAAEPQQQDTVHSMPNTFKVTANLKSPRVIKSHLHISLLPEQLLESVKSGINSSGTSPKIVYTVRNPKAAVLSFYHHNQVLDGYTGTLEEFVEAFMADGVLYCPYWSHVKEAWELKDSKNLLFLKFEDMKKDLGSVIKKTANFLGKSISASDVKKLEDHLSFQSMKNNPAVGNEGEISLFQNTHGMKLKDGYKFIRKGQTDSWKEELNQDLICKLDKWMQTEGIQGLY